MYVVIFSIFHIERFDTSNKYKIRNNFEVSCISYEKRQFHLQHIELFTITRLYNNFIYTNILREKYSYL